VSAEILEQWLAAVNSHDVSAVAALMAVNHVFVDSLGNRVAGAKSMEAGWRGYFAMCPDYWIRTDHTMADGETMLVAGEAGGTIDDSVIERQVFADNKPVYEILGRRRL
jgi:ketosteroid isomerase-like protein